MQVEPLPSVIFSSKAVAMAESNPFVDYLPDGAIALGFVASVKALDAEGNVSLYHLRDPEMNAWEALGALMSATDDLRAYLRGIGEDGNDD